MNNIFDFQRRFQLLESSVEANKLDERSRIDFAKVSIAFGELADCIEVIDSPQIQQLKASDIALYQEKIQSLLSSINDTLTKIESRLT